ncbi:MAG TPA: DEAD/DEAH box helicase [Steroidobacteraceae bacterium]|nr:DEAD/DEAH box helicase [Steroidobacteraceae bacterium]
MFKDFSLCPQLLRAIEELGYTEPTPIQLRAIPWVLEGRDVLAAAQTGTGKTAAFALPLLQRLQNSIQRQREPRVLVLVPTRELAAQVSDAFRALARHLPIRGALIFGGVSPKPQLQALAAGVDLVIATPGRLLDHMQAGAISLSRVEALVLDEADRMLDMGFIHAIRRIIRALPKQRQNLMFSATLPEEIRSLARTWLVNPAVIDVAPRNAPAALVDHRVYHVESSGKHPLLTRLIVDGGIRQSLVFTRTKHGANRLAQRLEKDGLAVAAIHGNKSQGARTRALEDFKQGRVQVLVATDIAARGLDISELPHVVNFELPHVPEDYVHRIGRTGRAGLSGKAVSLVSREERDRLRAIEKLLGHAIPVAAVAAAA